MDIEADALLQVGRALRGSSGAFEQLRQAFAGLDRTPAQSIFGLPHRHGGFVPPVDNRDTPTRRVQFRAGIAPPDDGLDVLRIERLPRSINWDFCSPSDQRDWTAIQNYGPDGVTSIAAGNEPPEGTTAAQILEAIRSSACRVEPPEQSHRASYYPEGTGSAMRSQHRRSEYAWQAVRERIRAALSMRYRLDARVDMLGPSDLRVRAEIRGDNDIANVMRGTFLEILDEPGKWQGIAERLEADDVISDAHILLENEAYLFLCTQNDGLPATSRGLYVAETVYQFSADGRLVQRYAHHRNEYRRIMDQQRVGAATAAIKHAMVLWVTGRRR